MVATNKRRTLDRKKLRQPPKIEDEIPALKEGKKPRTKKPKETQKFLSEDMKPGVHEDIEAAAEVYANIRDARMELTEQESEQQGKLLEVMRQHMLKTYKMPDGRIVEVVAGDEKVKVKKPKVRLVDDDE